MCMVMCVNTCSVDVCTYMCVNACMLVHRRGYRMDVHGIQVAEAATEVARLRKAEGICAAAIMH